MNINIENLKQYIGQNFSDEIKSAAQTAIIREGEWDHTELYPVLLKITTPLIPSGYKTDYTIVDWTADCHITLIDNIDLDTKYPDFDFSMGFGAVVVEGEWG